MSAPGGTGSWSSSPCQRAQWRRGQCGCCCPSWRFHQAHSKTRERKVRTTYLLHSVSACLYRASASSLVSNTVAVFGIGSFCIKSAKKSQAGFQGKESLRCTQVYAYCTPDCSTTFIHASQDPPLLDNMAAANNTLSSHHFPQRQQCTSTTS